MADTPKPAKKLTRAEKRVINRAALLRTQAQEYAIAKGVPPTLLAVEEAEERRELARVDPSLHHRNGRPVEYTEAEGAGLCAWIEAGGSLRSWCLEHGRSMATVQRWIGADPRFQARYALAHETRADTLADEMMDIADRAAIAPTIESVAAAKLRCETRRFIASKLRPQKWGDHQTVQHTGAVSIRIGLPRADLVQDAVLLPATDPPKG